MIAWLLVALAATWPGEPDASSAPWSALDTGVEWLDLQTGAGEAAEVGAKVVVHYTGMLADGTVFDSSVERGTPFSFRIGDHQVIRGWEDGLVGAAPGTTRRLVIPPSQGYGNRNSGPIPPGSTLYFEVQVLEVIGPRKAPAAAKNVDPSAFKLKKGVGVAELEIGTGRKPVKGERVCVDWTAWSGGRMVEHTFDREDCYWFRYEEGKVAQGLFLGIATMREGGLRQLRIPAELVAPPNRPEGVTNAETLLYEVRLIEARPKSR